MTQRPLIGITAYNYIRPESGWRYDVSYGKNAEAVERAGGLPVLIPSFLNSETLRAIYDRLDAFLLPGGGDINPKRYKQDANTKLYDVDDHRDEMEITMMQWAVEDQRPVLGICRGIQLMNVALGGTLTQDIDSHIQTDLTHSYNIFKEPRGAVRHDVQIEADSQLARIFGEQTLPVNSLHHQTLKEVAPQLRVVATAPDGLIEGVEIPDQPFMMAVQWHPEDMIDNDTRMQRLFNAFVAAARERMT